MPLLTPHFDLSQTHKHLVIKLRLPYVKVSKSEITILNNEFHFFLKPYSLKLVFQH
jgi:protein SHQ1